MFRCFGMRYWLLPLMILCMQELSYWNARNIISQRRFQVLEKGRFWYFEIFLGDLFGVLRGIGRPPFSLSLHNFPIMILVICTFVGIACLGQLYE